MECRRIVYLQRLPKWRSFDLTLIFTLHPLDHSEDQIAFQNPRHSQDSSGKALDDILNMEEAAEDIDYDNLVNTMHPSLFANWQMQNRMLRFWFSFWSWQFDGHYHQWGNDSWLNTHNRVQLSAWRANVDSQIILHVKACVASIGQNDVTHQEVI